MSKTKKQTPNTTNKVEPIYGKLVKILAYMVAIDKLVLNLSPKDKGITINYSTLEKDYGQNDTGGYELGKGYCLYQSNELEKNYIYSFNIIKDDECVGKIHFNGRANNKHLIKLQFENKIFYQQGDGWYKYYVELCEILGLMLHNISEVHICFDASGLYKWFLPKWYNSDCKENLRNPRYKRMFKTTNYGHQGTEFFMGDDSAGKVIVLYKKTLEILHSKKFYISEAHLLNGLDINEGVDRVEARLKDKWLRDYPITLEALLTQEGLERIFAKAIKETGFRDLKAPEVRDHNDNYKHVLLPLFYPGVFKARPMEKIKRDEDRTDGRKERAIIITFKNLFDEYIRMGRPDSLRYLRHYMGCEENFIGVDNSQRHNGLIALRELSLTKYRAMVERYRKSYTRDKKVVTEAMKARLRAVEEDLFSKPNTTEISLQGESKFTSVKAITNLYSSNFFRSTSV